MQKIKTKLDRQLFNDGFLKLYEIKNVAGRGMMPQYSKVVVCERVPFAYKTAGEKRHYYAAQYGKAFDTILKVDEHYSVAEGNIVEINEDMYKVISVNKIFTIYPNILEVSVRRVSNIDECID